MTIEDRVVATVEGTVGRRFSSKSGNAFELKVKREGLQYPDVVTVWNVRFDVEEGDRVKVSGKLSWRKAERNGKTYVAVSLNAPKLLEREPGEPRGGLAYDDGDEPF